MSGVPEPFDVQIEAHGAELWVRPAGDLDLAGAPELRESLDLALRSDAQSIVLDLRRLEFLDSAGLRVIVDACTSRGGERVSLVQGNDRVRGVFVISGLDRRLPFRPVA
jgi:anti-sigma B factor antagonist